LKIFLSGKVDEEHGKWRDYFLVREYNYITHQYENPWTLKTTDGNIDWNNPNNLVPWPIKEKSIFQAHDYTGPYKQIVVDAQCYKSLGDVHGITSAGQHGCINDNEMQSIVNKCKCAIDAADIIFAYINSNDCYGTLSEIGYAVAKGKFVIVAENNNESYWFARYISHFNGYNWQLSNETEPEYLKRLLLEGISQYTVWKHPEPSLVNEARYSFNQIKKWSSDPRVRSEADRMLSRIKQNK